MLYIHQKQWRNKRTNGVFGTIMFKAANPSPSFRIHLVRHGETVANEKGIVLGQIDSPLTHCGIDQAEAANKAFGNYPFWRKYSSDLPRAQRTARIILGIEKPSSKDDGYDTDKTYSDYDFSEDAINLHLDSRLRERAKGVREGQDKSLTYEQAWDKYREARFRDGLVDESKWKIPKLENEEEVWERVRDFLEEKLFEAYMEFETNQNSDYISKRRKQGSLHGVNEFDLLAVTHSGTLRIIIEKMVGDQLPENIEREAQDKNGVREGRLKVPNTSKTVIEFKPCENPENLLKMKLSNGKCLYWEPHLVDLTDIKHLMKR